MRPSRVPSKRPRSVREKRIAATPISEPDRILERAYRSDICLACLKEPKIDGYTLCKRCLSVCQRALIFPSELIAQREKERANAAAIREERGQPIHPEDVPAIAARLAGGPVRVASEEVVGGVRRILWKRSEAPVRP